MAGMFGQRIYYKEEMTSTNTEAKRLAVGEAFHGLLVLADQQTMGRGRQGRSWSSPKGTGIFMSLLLKPELAPEKAAMLTPLAALSVAVAIEKVTGLPALIKWPNDIVIGSRKVCGILTEMSTDTNQICYIVLGIGINVNTTEFPPEIRQTATSLLLEKYFAAQKKSKCQKKGTEDLPENFKIDRKALLDAVLNELEKYYEEFLLQGDLAFLQEAYNEKLVNRNRQVRVIDGTEKNEITGTAGGMNEKGELLIQTENGLVTIRSGEVSVRGLYGYVE